jgi:hypothetical protein
MQLTFPIDKSTFAEGIEAALPRQQLNALAQREQGGGNTEEGERIQATISDVINYLAQKAITANRWWVARLIGRREAELTVQKALVLELSRHEVAPDDVKRYFDILREDYRSIPSLSVWNVVRHELVHRKKQRHQM